MSESGGRTNGDEQQPSELVVQAVADHRGVDPVDLTPLYEVFDPDALDALLASADDGRVSVEFVYADCSVEVDGSGAVEVTDAEIS